MTGYVSIFEGIIFVEGDAPEARYISEVKVDLSFKLGAHMKNLNDVKHGLAENCKTFGGNCVCQFKYGQKSRWLAIDDVAYFGSGVACLLSAEDYNASCDKVIARG